VLLDDPHPAGSAGMTEAVLALTYDPSILSVSSSDITLGSIPSLGGNWQLQSMVDQATGQIAVVLYSTTPVAEMQPGSLITLVFHVAHGASVPATAVQLVSVATIGGEEFVTQVDDAQGRFVVSSGLERRLLERVRPKNNTFNSPS
jgi:hypothetical protein